MKMRTIFPVLFLTVFASQSLKAQSFTDLKELKRLKIVVEELDPDATRAGITKDALESQLLNHLKADLPNVEIDNAAVPYVYLRVVTSLNGNWCAVRVVMQIWRPVMILKDGGEPIGATLANVRDRGTTLTGPARTMGAKVLEDVRQKITELAADYHEANP